MKQVDSTVHPRLYRRGARYYHRAAIPLDIKETYPKTEETFSLGTTDYQEAVRRVRKAAVEVDQRFAEHRRQLAQTIQPMDRLSADQIEQLAWRYYVNYLAEEERQRREFDWSGSADFDAPYEALHGELEKASSLYSLGRVDDRFQKAAMELVRDAFDRPLAPGSPSWNDLTWKIQESFMRVGKDILARQRGELVPTPSDPALSVPEASQPFSDGSYGYAHLSSSCSTVVASAPHSVAHGPMLSAVVEEWLEEKTRDWTPKTRNDHRITLTNFITIVGDRPLPDFGKSDGRAFKAILMKLPPNWNKQKALQALPIDAAAEKADKLGMSPMSGKNVNKIIGYAAAFWNWAAKHYDECPPNPLNGLKVAIKKRAREERDPFSLEELRTIFRAPIFTGCKSLHHWRQPGALIPRDSGMYWVPLVSLFTGARMGEVLQLYVSDVKRQNDIDFIDINGDGADKSLKTISSWRQTPIHPGLKRLGFLEHVQKMRQQGSRRLFPDMPMGNDGYYSSVYSKRFRALLDSLKIKHVQNAFHSLRHNFEDACRNSGVSKEVMDALQGHSEAGQSARYGSGYALESLNDAICRLEHRGLDLSHLSPGW